MERLSWLNKGFICKELYAPFILERDIDYLDDLRQRYRLVRSQAKKAGADKESVKIINQFSERIVEAINCYYKADLLKSNTIIRNLVIMQVL